MMKINNQPMNRNNILLTVLTILSLAFIGLLAILLNRPESFFLQQATQDQRVAQIAKPQLVNLSLVPAEVVTTVGETVIVSINFENLTSGIEATDLVLNYDPEQLEFVSLNALNPSFTNPRALAEENRLVLSFISASDSATINSAKAVAMGELVFRAKKAGRSRLVPDLSNTGKGSLLIGSSSNDNQLTSGNSVEVTINNEK